MCCSLCPQSDGGVICRAEAGCWVVHYFPSFSSPLSWLLCPGSPWGAMVVVVLSSWLELPVAFFLLEGKWNNKWKNKKNLPTAQEMSTSLGPHFSVVVSFSIAELHPVVSLSSPLSWLHCCFHQLLAPVFHPASSGSQGWGWVLWCWSSLVIIMAVVAGHRCAISGAVISLHLNNKRKDMLVNNNKKETLKKTYSCLGPVWFLPGIDDGGGEWWAGSVWWHGVLCHAQPQKPYLRQIETYHYKPL